MNNLRVEDPIRPYCCRCSHEKPGPSLIKCIFIHLLVVIYILFGGVMFMLLEGNISKSKTNFNQLSGQEKEFVEKIWSITEEQNVLHKENWTMLVDKEFINLKKSSRGYLRYEPIEEMDNCWTFATSVLYSMSLITNIGSSGVAPISTAGKIAAVPYLFVGLLLIILYLVTLGEALARKFTFCFSKICPKRFRRTYVHTEAECIIANKDISQERQNGTPFGAVINHQNFNEGLHCLCPKHGTRVPLFFILILMILYIGLRRYTRILDTRESLRDGYTYGQYFCIMKSENIAIDILLSSYILVEFVFFAMCYKLIKKELTIFVQSNLRALYAERIMSRDVEIFDRSDANLRMSDVSAGREMTEAFVSTQERRPQVSFGLNASMIETFQSPNERFNENIMPRSPTPYNFSQIGDNDVYVETTVMEMPRSTHTHGKTVRFTED